MTLEGDPVDLCRLATTVTTLAGDLRDDLASAREKVTLSTNVFGNTSGAGDLGATYDGLTEDACAAVDDVAGVLEGDVDRLYRVAFALQATDHDNAGDIADSGAAPSGH